MLRNLRACAGFILAWRRRESAGLIGMLFPCEAPIRALLLLIRPDLSGEANCKNTSKRGAKIRIYLLASRHLTPRNKKRTFCRLSLSKRTAMDPDQRSAWLRKLDEECPYQVVLPRAQLSDDSKIMDFLTSYVGKFDMYVEDEYAAFVRYCFEDPLDAAIFRSRFEPKVERLKLVG
jgi:hypothetical protein